MVKVEYSWLSCNILVSCLMFNFLYKIQFFSKKIGFKDGINVMNTG